MRIRRIASLAVALSLLSFGSAAASRAASARSTASLLQTDAALRARLLSAPAGVPLTFVVHFRDQANMRQTRTGSSAKRQAEVIRELRAKSDATFAGIRPRLQLLLSQKEVTNFQPLWILNSFSVTATPRILIELASRGDVESMTADDIGIVSTGKLGLASSSAAANVAATSSSALWDLGYTGQGVVVADLDSGVEATHPDLVSRYRGGTNSWYDPYGQHPTTPTDRSGHGTATTGAIVAGAGSGSSLGVAPGAKWIAARVFNDAGGATTTAIHLALQWALDPDNNPATADAPNIVNNSWSFGNPGCNFEFQPDLQALRSAGIIPVFAAGNFGPGASTSVSPSNYPEAISVGVTDNNGVIDPMSANGPSSCGEPSTTYPDVVAPGIDVTSTDLFGGYATWTGTSLSAPSVTGALALLLSTHTGTDAQAEAALLGTTVDLGPTGPDNQYGAGRINTMAAYQLLLQTGTPTTTTTTTTLPSTTTTTLPPTTTTTLPPTTTTLPPTTTTTTLPPTTTTLPPTTTTTLPPTTTTLPPTTTTTVAANGLVFANDFESGTLTGWSSSVGSVSATTSSALAGSFGLQATLSNSSSAYVADATPVALTNYHARFIFSPNSAVIGGTSGHTIFSGVDATGTALVVVQVRKTSTGYELRVGDRTSGMSTPKYSAWTSITNAAHTVEVSWTAATSNTVRNGLSSLWIDGTLKQTVTGLQNGTMRLEESRLGPQGTGSSTSGAEYFDSFVSTKGAYIGV